MASGFRGLLELLGLWPSSPVVVVPPTLDLDGTFTVRASPDTALRVEDFTRVVIVEDKQRTIAVVDRTHTRKVRDARLIRAVLLEG